jgi:hypothetical protein
MGCDMTVCFEALVKVTGKWEFIGISRSVRDYRLFARIAGVRNGDYGTDNYIEPMDYPRGFPTDVSKLTRIYHGYKGSRNYSLTYLSQGELIDLSIWRGSSKTLFKDMGGNILCLFDADDFDWVNAERCRSYFETIRVICWFDE